MIWLWTWGGVSFGYRDKDALWTHDGRNVARFIGFEAYAPDGYYLGEAMGQRRLITRKAKVGMMQERFAPLPRRLRSVRRAGLWANTMYGGFTDFPDPEVLR